jgi:hypothetical protein
MCLTFIFVHEHVKTKKTILDLNSHSKNKSPSQGDGCVESDFVTFKVDAMK